MGDHAEIEVKMKVKIVKISESIENTFVEDPNYFEDSSSADIKIAVTLTHMIQIQRQFLERCAYHIRKSL